MTDWTCKRCLLVTSADHSTGDCIAALRKRVRVLETDVQARKDLAHEEPVSIAGVGGMTVIHPQDWRHLVRVTPIVKGVISGAGGAGGSGFIAHSGGCSMAECQGNCIT